MGQKPTAGYSVRLASAALTGDTLDLSVAVRTPPADSVQAQVMTSPCAILALEPGKWNAIRLHGLTERPLLLRP
nr:protease complex subunit PrcB family protein [Marinobacter lutaoensis]